MGLSLANLTDRALRAAEPTAHTNSITDVESLLGKLELRLEEHWRHTLKEELACQLTRARLSEPHPVEVESDSSSSSSSSDTPSVAQPKPQPTVPIVEDEWCDPDFVVSSATELKRHKILIGPPERDPSSWATVCGWRFGRTGGSRTSFVAQALQQVLCTQAGQDWATLNHVQHPSQNAWAPACSRSAPLTEFVSCTVRKSQNQHLGSRSNFHRCSMSASSNRGLIGRATAHCL